MTTTETREELWARAQENLDTHVRLARELQAGITDCLRGFDTTKDGVIALYTVGLVALVQHGAEVTTAPERPGGPAFWRWLVSLFRTAPVPAALDLVNDELRDQLAGHWALARSFYERASAGTGDPVAITITALNLHLPSQVAGRGQAVDLLGAVLLALTAVWEF